MGQNLTGVAVSGNSERISPGVIHSEVGRLEGLWLAPGRPTSEHITPGEIRSEFPKIATTVRFWHKFLENLTAVNLQNISCGLVVRVVDGFTKTSHKKAKKNKAELTLCWLCFRVNIVGQVGN